MPKVAPSPGGHRAAPALKGKGKKGAAAQHRDAPPPPDANVLRKTEELSSMLRLRNEELVARDNDLTACGEQLEQLEAHAEKLQNERNDFEKRLGARTLELEMLQAEHQQLTEKHAALRAEFTRVRAENETHARLINATPGIMPIPDSAIQAIRRAQHAKDAVKPAVAATASSPSRVAGAARTAATPRSPRAAAADARPQQQQQEEEEEEDVASGPPWKLQTWLGTTRLLSLVSEALLQPLGELHASEPQPTELSFVRTLASASGGYDALLQLLSQNELQLLKDVARALHDALKRMGERAPPRQNEVCGKYVALLESDGALTPGTSRLAKGQRLESIIGPPEKRVLETMLSEHCEALDSALPFVDATYLVTTTSRIEWWFVVDAAEGLSKQLDVKTELSGEVVGGGRAVPRLGASGYPAEAGLLPPDRMRQPRPLPHVLSEMRQLSIGGRLRAVGIEPLLDAEVIAARLYTGPLHAKYNAVLRGRLAGEGSAAYDAFAALCRGNPYTTTLHALRSAVHKLSQIGTAHKVYRGVASSFVPPWLWKRPPAGSATAETASRGGIELGFLSATTDAEQAMKYASEAVDAADGSAKRIVLELHTGLTSRGAELSWLSQYPHERETCFVPGTGHELLSSRVDGTCVIVELQLAVQGEPETLQEILARLKRSHLQLIDTYIDDMKSCEVPEKALGRLRALANTHKRYEQSYYNNPDKFRASTTAAVDAQRQALSRLAHPSTWDEVSGDTAEKARKMEKAAAYCRRVGRGDVASALHRLACTLTATKGKFKAWRPGGNRVETAGIHALA